MRFPLILLLAAALPLSSCAELFGAPEGAEDLEEDECLLTLAVSASCTGCEGFDRYDVSVTDAAGDVWEVSLGEGEEWSGVVARGMLSIEYAAVLFGYTHENDPEPGYCEVTHDVSFGCSGFDFC